MYTTDSLSSGHVCRYAGLLEAAMSRHVPKVGPIDSKELLDFCADSVPSSTALLNAASALQQSPTIQALLY